MIVSALAAALIGLVFGGLLDHDPEAFRWMCPVASLAGIVAAALYARVRVRRGAMLQVEEVAETSAGLRLSQVLRPLIVDAPFRRFMTCLFVLGSGNMMVDAPLIAGIVVADAGIAAAAAAGIVVAATSPSPPRRRHRLRSFLPATTAATWRWT